MTKFFAPCPATWRGKPIEIAEDGSADMPLEALVDLAPHGFRLWTDEDDLKVGTGDTTDPDNMSRGQLIKLLAGKVEGRVILMTNDELRELAKKQLHKETTPVQSDTPPTNGSGLRLDGPTQEEWVNAGYPAVKYPPDGYAPRLNHFDTDNKSTWPAVWN